LIGLSRQDEEQIAQAVEIGQNRLRRRGLGKCGDRRLSAPRNRARHMEAAARFVLAGEDEFP
jgi:hypothetical protein